MRSVLVLMSSCSSYLESLHDGIFRAAETDDAKNMERLLLLGVSPVVCGGRFNATPLHDTALHNSKKVAQLLLNHDANIEARDKYNRTPLHIAAKYKSTIVAELLLEHNVNIEARDNLNRTPLYIAASYNLPKVAQLLLKHNADIEARDEHNLTPLSIAKRKINKKVVKLLLRHNARQSNTSLRWYNIQQHKSGTTVAHTDVEARGNDNKEVPQLLLKRKSKRERPSNTSFHISKIAVGDRPLMTSTRRGRQGGSVLF